MSGHSGKDPQAQQQQPTSSQPQQPSAPAKKAASDAAPGGARRGAPGVAPGGCFSWGCKTDAKRFNFCDEHYEHFKFGLIKKTGEPVPDYEKKIEHYLHHRDRDRAKKVA